MANLRVRARRRPEDYVSNRNISNIFEAVLVLDKLMVVVPTKVRSTSWEPLKTQIKTRPDSMK